MDEKIPAKPAALEGLSLIEAGDLSKAERQIEAAVTAVAAAGSALIEIRDRRLYRSSHRSFDEYLVERWGFKRGYADRLIGAAEVVEILSAKAAPSGREIEPAPLPTSERVARPLAKLKDQPAKMSKAWKAAVKKSDGSPTAKEVAAAVEEQLPIKRQDAPPPDPLPVQLMLDFSAVVAMEEPIAKLITAASTLDEIEALKGTVNRWVAALNAKTAALRPAPPKARKREVAPNFKSGKR